MKIMQYLETTPLSKKVFYLIMVIFGGMFYTMVIANHYYFRAPAFDYGTYNFAFWDYAHLHSSVVPFYHPVENPYASFLQSHFSLILMYFVPVYWALNWLTGTYTLVIIQTTLMLWSAWALYRLIKLKTNDDWLGVIAVLYFFLLQGTYSAFTCDCTILTMVCCFVTPFLFYFESRKYLVAFILFILILFSREDMPLWCIFIFTLLLIWHWKDRKVVRYCMAGILTSIVYFIMVFKVFIPMCETNGSHYYLFQYSVLGATPWEALLHIIKHPIETFKIFYVNQLHDHIYDDVKKEFYMVYLISGGFLLFLRPQYFIWFIPVIAQKMFNDLWVRWSIYGYYAVPMAPILPISVFLIISIFKTKRVRYSLAGIVCILAFFVTRYTMNSRNLAMPWISTTKQNIFDPKFFNGGFDGGFDAAKVHKNLELIPPDVKVCASTYILPHLAQRKDACLFPEVGDAEYIAIFTPNDYYPLGEEIYSNAVFRYLSNPSWGVIAYTPPFLLLKKNSGNLKNNNFTDSLECGAEIISPDKLHFVTSGGELLDNADTRDSMVKHGGNYSIRLNKNRQYGFTYHGTKFKPGDLLKISVWKYPAYKDTGALVISCGKDFYRYVSGGDAKDSTGWIKLTMYLAVPEDDKDFKIYAWNNTPADVWFDDIKIVRYSINITP